MKIIYYMYMRLFFVDLHVREQWILSFYSQRGSLLGAEHFFQKYVNDLEKQEPCCPLCHREFDTDQEVKELIIEVSRPRELIHQILSQSYLVIYNGILVYKCITASFYSICKIILRIKKKSNEAKHFIMHSKKVMIFCVLIFS